MERHRRELRPRHQPQHGQRREDKAEDRSSRKPITKLTITGMLIIGNSTDHHVSTADPLAIAITIRVMVSSQSDSVLGTS